MRPIEERRQIFHKMTGEQLGLISLAQLKALGWSPATVRSRVNRGILERVLPTVFSIPQVPDSWERKVLAACLWAGDGSAASFGCAARIWGLQSFRAAPVEISTVSRKRDLAVPFVSHRVDHFLRKDIRRVGPIPATSVERTLMDLAGKKHPATPTTLNEVLRHQLSTLGELGLAYEEAWRRGRRGIAIMRDLLLERLGVAAPTDSQLEDIFLALVKSAGLPAPKQQYKIVLPHGHARLDFAYPDARVAIELDGYQWHSDRPSFESDRRRDNALSRMGWIVLRITWMMLREDPNGVVELVRHHLTERQALPAGSSGQNRQIAW